MLHHVYLGSGYGPLVSSTEALDLVSSFLKKLYKSINDLSVLTKESHIIFDRGYSVPISYLESIEPAWGEQLKLEKRYKQKTKILSSYKDVDRFVVDRAENLETSLVILLNEDNFSLDNFEQRINLVRPIGARKAFRSMHNIWPAESFNDPLPAFRKLALPTGRGFTHPDPMTW